MSDRKCARGCRLVMSGTSLSPRPITRTSFGVSNESSYPRRQLCVVLVIKTFHWEPNVCLPTALSSPAIRCSIVRGGWSVVERGIAVQRRTVSGGARTIGIHLGFEDFRKTVSGVSTRIRSDNAVKCGNGLEMPPVGFAPLRLKTLSRQRFRIGSAQVALHRVVKVWRWWVCTQCARPARYAETRWWVSNGRSGSVLVSANKSPRRVGLTSESGT